MPQSQISVNRLGANQGIRTLIRVGVMIGVMTIGDVKALPRVA